MDETEIDLRKYLEVLRKWRWMILGVVIVAAVTAGVISKFVLPKVYEASTLLMVTTSDQQSTVVSQNGLDQLLNSVSSLPQNSVDTYVGELTSDTMLSLVAKELPKRSGGQPFDYATLRGMVTVSSVQGADQKGTNLIQVSVDDTSPEQAALIANKVSQAFLQYLSQQNQDVMARSVTFLENQATNVGAQRSVLEKKLVGFNAGQNPVSLLQAEIQGRTTDLQNLNSQIQASQVAVAADQAAEKSLSGQMKGLTATTILPPDPKSSDQPTAVENPVYTSTQEAEIQAAAKLAQDQAQLQELQSQSKGLNQQLVTLNKLLVTEQTTQNDLQNQLSLMDDAYQTLSKKVTDTQVAEASRLGETSVDVASAALPPNVPIKPSAKKNVAMAVVLALLVAVGLAFLLEYLDGTIKTPEDVEMLVHLPTLGSIPRAGLKGGRA